VRRRPDATWTVDPTALASRSRNTPYAAHPDRAVRHTILAGEPVVVDARPSDEPPGGAARREPALLVLADGAVFEGEASGGAADHVATGEAVFNTVLSGTRRSSRPVLRRSGDRLHVPHIGNYGVNAADDEATRPLRA